MKIWDKTTNIYDLMTCKKASNNLKKKINATGKPVLRN